MFYFIIPLLLLSSCGTCDNIQSKSGNNANEEGEKERYECDLTLDNYWHFIDFKCSTTNPNSARPDFYLTFDGVLSYAYYENVSFCN